MEWRIYVKLHCTTLSVIQENSAWCLWLVYNTQLLKVRKVTWHCCVLKWRPTFIRRGLPSKLTIGHHSPPAIYLPSLPSSIIFFVLSILGTSPMILSPQSIQYTRGNFTSIYWVSTTWGLFKAIILLNVLIWGRYPSTDGRFYLGKRSKVIQSQYWWMQWVRAIKQDDILNSQNYVWL